jgi:transcriptional regulator GlxA family with amidase domain
MQAVRSETGRGERAASATRSADDVEFKAMKSLVGAILVLGLLVALPLVAAGPVELPADRPLRVGFLIVDGVYNSELMAPYDIFHHTVFHVQPGMEVFTVSPDGEAVTTFEGLSVGAHYSFASAPPIDVLVVPSAEHSMDADLQNAALMAWVRRVGGEARFVVSLCDGAFVLAAAGLLHGLASTTFPGDVEAYRAMFPRLDVRLGVSFVHDGKALTSQGGARSYDVAMYLVDHIYGPEVAAGVGRGMVLDWPLPENDRQEER